MASMLSLELSLFTLTNTTPEEDTELLLTEE